jgi:hypothetical protein
MAPSGRRPKPRGQAVTRHPRAYDWVEVDPAPFDGGPSLPARRRDGTAWPEWTQATWDAWRTMPHARLWREPDWEFARDTLELASRAFDDDTKIGLLAEIRYREKVMGTTWSARQDMRIRYESPTESQSPACVTSPDEYRDL